MAKDGKASDVTIEVLLLAATAQSMPGSLLALRKCGNSNVRSTGRTVHETGTTVTELVSGDIGNRVQEHMRAERDIHHAQTLIRSVSVYLRAGMSPNKNKLSTGFGTGCKQTSHTNTARKKAVTSSINITHEQVLPK